MKQGQIVTLLFASLPDPQKIYDFEFPEKEVRFSLDGSRYRIKEDLSVHKIDFKKFLKTPSSKLIQSLLTKKNSQNGKANTPFAGSAGSLL